MRGARSAPERSEIDPAAIRGVLGDTFILEVNPNPSINMGDCVPNCAEMTGLKYEDFIEEILREAISRYRARPPYYHLQSALAAL